MIPKSWHIPAWFLALEKQRISQAVTTALSWQVDAPRSPHTPRSLVVFNLLGEWPSEAIAVKGALLVLEAIAAAIKRHPDEPVDERRRTTDHLRDDVIVWADQYRSSGMDTLEHAINAALDAAPWWTSARASAPVEATSAESLAVPDRRPPVTIKDAAKQLGLTDDKIRRMGDRGEIHILKLGPRSHRVPQAEIDRLKRLPKIKYPDRR